MISLHPEFLTKDGKKAFAVIPYEEFVALQEVLADAADLIDLRAAKADEAFAAGAPLNEVKSRLGLEKPAATHEQPKPDQYGAGTD